MNDTIQAAENLLAAGLALVTMPLGSKAPTQKDWQKNPITTTAQLSNLQREMNIGLHHGASGTGALDIDHVQYAELALRSVGIELGGLLAIPGPKVQTRKALKPIYQIPNGLKLSRHALAFKNPDGKYISVLELRAENVQDLLPPSIHPSGFPYTWEGPPPKHRGDIPVLPDPLQALWENWDELKPLLEAVLPWATPPSAKPYSVPKGIRDGPSVIDTFNAKHDVWNLLEQHGYVAKGQDRFTAPDSQTRIPGVRLLTGDDGTQRCYSHHGSDPLADGHSHDAFSVYTVLEHNGDVRQAVKAAASLLDMCTPEPNSNLIASGETVAIRPKIKVNARPLRDIASDSVTALARANNPPFLFARGTAPVRVGTDNRIEVLNPTSLKGVLDRTCDFVKVAQRDGETQRSEIPVRPPHDLAPDLLTSGTLSLPQLEAVVNTPVFSPTGRLLLSDGFDPEYGLLLRLGTLASVRSDLTIKESLTRLWAVLRDFPFANDAGKAHVLVALLQPFVRPMIHGPTPLYLINAPSRGTGKSLLAELIALITLGFPAPVMSQPKDGDELEKRITTVMLEGLSLLLLDNVTRLDSPHLAAALTADTWVGRILGKTELVTVPNRALWLATGNNPGLSDELARRIVPIRLDAGVERPENRNGFKIPNLPEFVLTHRAELVSALLSLVQQWIGVGTPKGQRTLGRYESWAGIMGGILDVAGVSGFLTGREELYSEADSETNEWAATCAVWWSKHQHLTITAKDLFEILKDHNLLLDLWGGRTSQGALQRIGHALSHRRDRVFGRFKIQRAGQDGITRSAAYRLTRVGNKTPETTETTGAGAENPSETQKGDQWFSGGFEPETRKTTENHRKTTDGENPVQHAVSDTESVVSVVSVVLNRPPASADTEVKA